PEDFRIESSCFGHVSGRRLPEGGAVIRYSDGVDTRRERDCCQQDRQQHSPPAHIRLAGFTHRLSHAVLLRFITSLLSVNKRRRTREPVAAPSCDLNPRPDWLTAF